VSFFGDCDFVTRLGVYSNFARRLRNEARETLKNYLSHHFVLSIAVINVGVTF